MRMILLSASLAFLCSGCAATQLKYSTGRTTNTLVDMQYSQVLDNLARFVDNPGTMPYYAIIGQGTVLVTDQGAVQDALTWVHHAFPLSIFSIGPFSRSVAEQWQMAPVTDPDKLKQIRCLFQQVSGQKFADCYDCQKQLKDVATDDKCRELAPCWFHVGGKWDVPRDALYVGRHGHTVVWVTDEGVDSLTRLSLAVQDIATSSGTPTQNINLAITGAGRVSLAPGPGVAAEAAPARRASSHRQSRRGRTTTSPSLT